jgi:hypothetical protein
MSDWLKAILNMVLGGVLLAGISEWWKKYLRKERESLEVTNIKRQGAKVILEYQTDLDKLVNEKTQKLRDEIQVLKDLQLQQAKDLYESEKEKAKLMSEMESKLLDQQKTLNTQFEMTKNIAKGLQDEMALRTECMNQLQDLKKKLNM